MKKRHLAAKDNKYGKQKENTDYLTEYDLDAFLSEVSATETE